MMPLSLSQDQLILINLLLRIAVMAGIISLVLGFRSVVELLARLSVTKSAYVRLFVILSVIFAIGIVVRKLSSQAAMDLALEGALIAGFLGGVGVGAGTGFVIGLTCWIFGEFVALPLYTVAGFSAGMLYTWLGRRGEIWNFSLNPFLIIYNFVEKLFRGGFDRNFIPFALCVSFSLIRYVLLGMFYRKGWLYGYPMRDWFFMTIDVIVLVYTVGIALKMANNARMEEILREEENQLMQARLATLRSQINPHFLFNTLNSISALIRTDAEKAREMTRTLASIFRKSLENTADAHSLADEIAFIDDYLSIEKIRFGEEKLKVVKDLGPGTECCRLPTMLLQPVVENAVKHGISQMTEGGTIVIAARRSGRGTEIKVSNEGPVTGPLALEELLPRGVGLRNVVERLKIYSRGEGMVAIAPADGGGVSVRLFIPDCG